MFAAAITSCPTWASAARPCRYAGAPHTREPPSPAGHCPTPVAAATCPHGQGQQASTPPQVSRDAAGRCTSPKHDKRIVVDQVAKILTLFSTLLPPVGEGNRVVTATHRPSPNGTQHQHQQHQQHGETHSHVEYAEGTLHRPMATSAVSHAGMLTGMPQHQRHQPGHRGCGYRTSTGAPPSAACATAGTGPCPRTRGRCLSAASRASKPSTASPARFPPKAATSAACTSARSAGRATSTTCRARPACASTSGEPRGRSGGHYTVYFVVFFYDRASKASTMQAKRLEACAR